jgi:hypothetical protein
MCLCAGFFVVIMLLCWATRDHSNAKPVADVAQPKDNAGSDGAKYVMMDPDEQQVMKPPIVGPPLGAEYPMAPQTRYDERKFAELPRGGLSCPNKRWYDSIYNGGAETSLDAPDVSKSDVQSLWEQDAMVRRRETRVARKIVPRPYDFIV